MIKQEEMLPMLVKACPSFSEKWEEHKKEYADEENYLPYIALSKFTNHLVDLFVKNKTEEFEKVFVLLEKLHIEGEKYVKEAATVGILEGLQNVAGNRGLDPKVFFKYLKPVSAKWWHEVNKFWDGEIQFIGQTIDTYEVAESDKDNSLG